MADTTQEVLHVQLLAADAIPPQQAHPTDAGYDLFSNEQITIQGHSWAAINTDIAITVPANTYGRVAPRSGLSLKGLDVLAGVIDQAYTGPVKVVLINHDHNPYTVNKHDKIAQLILEQIKLVPVKVVAQLAQTDRGANGFGSTGATAPPITN